MRPLCALIVAAFAVTVTSSWCAAQELCLSTADLQTQLTLCGQEPFRETDATVSDARLVTVTDSPVLLVLWNETSATDSVVPFYAISLDGLKIDVVRRTSYDLKLKYARFDPLLVDPVTEPALTADSANELYLVQFVTQPLPAFRLVLDKLGATVHGFVSNHVFVVRMGSTVVAQVESLPFVRAVRPHHPAYRLESYLRENFDQLGDEAAYSLPLSVGTAIWGDVAGDFDVANNVWLPPDGDADWDDITASLDKFRNLPGAPPKAHADVSPDQPDRIVDFIDIAFVVDAFRVLPYPFDGPDECPDP